MAHVGEELRFGLACPRELAVERLELAGGFALFFVEPSELGAHVVHPSRERSELVAIVDDHRRAEISLGDAVEDALGLSHGQDE